MLNRSTSLAMSTSVFKALPGNLDIKRHSLYTVRAKQNQFSLGQGSNRHLFKLDIIVCGIFVLLYIHALFDIKTGISVS